MFGCWLLTLFHTCIKAVGRNVVVHVCHMVGRLFIETQHYQQIWLSSLNFVMTTHHANYNSAECVDGTESLNCFMVNSKLMIVSSKYY